MRPAIDRPLHAVVVGLGQAGSRFDEEPGRQLPWSHTGAYLHLSGRYRLLGAADISRHNRDAFAKRCPDVPVYASVAELAGRARPEVASICTPPETHAEVLESLFACRDLRLVWCEKPLSHDFDAARRMAESCAARGIKLMVSYNRHWSPLWRRARDIADGGELGTVRSIRVAMPNRILSIGSHAASLLVMLGGAIETVAPLSLPALYEGGEPAITAALRFQSGAGGVLQVTGLKSQLVVEAEVLGDEGRVRVREDRGSIVTEKFLSSQIYESYRQLGPAREETFGDTSSAFVDMAQNAADALTEGRALECDGWHALEIQRILGLLAAAK